eukprot:FR736510.1.p1 GENE.FR736510.1~~FR736510.1.p1  ORF type:complete len:120 (+),score=4.18 FR736510.1:344-703(+)
MGYLPPPRSSHNNGPHEPSLLPPSNLRAAQDACKSLAPDIHARMNSFDITNRPPGECLPPSNPTASSNARATTTSEEPPLLSPVDAGLVRSCDKTMVITDSCVKLVSPPKSTQHAIPKL